MYFEKRYLQFNDLVFDGYDMISGWDADISFKGNSVAYSYGHGSYRPFKRSYNYVAESSVNMTITLNLKKMPCDVREFYARFAEEELSKHGRLWAIKNNEIIWAWAQVVNMPYVISQTQYKIVYDVEFVLPEGIWHKADKQKTFLVPYDVCILMDCKGYKEDTSCETNSDGGDCCAECLRANDTPIDTDCFCCCVDSLDADMALCYHTSELQAFYGCDTPYQLVYSCDDAEKFSRNDFLGTKMCVDCSDNMLSGRFYSNTDLPTDATIVLAGDMLNPEITINGNTNIIEGEYHGVLTIDASGDVYYQEDGCCDAELLDPSVWVIPEGNLYGWEIRPRSNSIIVNRNTCCDLAELNPSVPCDVEEECGGTTPTINTYTYCDRFCVYIQDNPITL